MRKETFSYLAIGVFTVFVLTGISYFTVCAAPAPTPTTEVLKIGGMFTLNNPWGVESQKCHTLLFDNLNAKGGIEVQGRRYRVQFISYDDKYTLDGGRAAAERLIYQDGVKFIIGPFASSAIIGAIPTCEKEKVLFINNSASDECFSPNYNYALRTQQAKAAQTSGWAWVMKKHPDVKTFVFLGGDTPFGRSFAKDANRCCQAYGVKSLGELYYPPLTTDFTDVATKIASLNPDYIYHAGDAGTRLGLIMKSLYDAGWHKIFAMGAGPIFGEIKSVSTPQAMEGLIFTSHNPAVFPEGELKRTPEFEELRKLYEAKYGGPWNGVGGQWLNAYYAFLAAIKKANSFDSTTVAKVLMAEQITFRCPRGEARTIQRPDLGINKYADTMGGVDIGVVKNMAGAYAGEVTYEDALASVEKVFGFKGQWVK